MINCLEDRELDAHYKTRLANAVNRLSPPLVGALVIICGICSVLLALHLAIWAENMWILIAVVVGLFLGVEYSSKPLHLKSRGVAHLGCLWLLLYFIPMLYSSMLVEAPMNLAVILLAATYATAEMGVILVNTAEDLPEDKACCVRTTAVAIGLKPTIALASGMVILGGAGFMLLWGVALLRNGLTVWEGFAAMILAISYFYVVTGMIRLTTGVMTATSSENAIDLIKKHAVLVPVWAMAIGVSGVLSALARFAGSR